jgi:hypothetical protein
VLKATGSQESDWKVEERTAESLRQVGQDKISRQDFTGVLNLILAAQFQDGNGSQFSAIRTLENEGLGLEQEKENLDAVTARVVRDL